MKDEKRRRRKLEVEVSEPCRLSVSGKNVFSPKLLISPIFIIIKSFSYMQHVYEIPLIKYIKYILKKYAMWCISHTYFYLGNCLLTYIYHDMGLEIYTTWLLIYVCEDLPENEKITIRITTSLKLGMYILRNFRIHIPIYIL